jgi:hypothetical protein
LLSSTTRCARSSKDDDDEALQPHDLDGTTDGARGQLTVADNQRAVAYSRGRLDERHEGAGGTAIDPGVTYRLDRQISDDATIELTSASHGEDWFSVRDNDRSELLWIEHRDEVEVRN